MDVRHFALGVVTLAFAFNASAQVTFYENDDFAGRAFTTQEPIRNFKLLGFNDRASSVVVTGTAWEVCDDADFRGHCLILRPGNYPSLRAMNMNDRLSSARAVERNRHYGDDRYAPVPLPSQVTFFEHADFQGRTFVSEGNVPNFARFGFNDRASSAVVFGDRWEVCQDANYSGRCVILMPGRYSSLGAMGLNDRVSSVRMIQATATFDDSRYAPRPVPAYDWRRRRDERVYEVNVTSTHAVFAASQQRCWMEREQVVDQRRDLNVGGAVVGGLLGGILGHQVGGGTGRDVATVGGAAAGALIGANVGRDESVSTVRDVQRCAAMPPQGRPEYWDVTYSFRGVEHHVQTTSPPGASITVNESGEPRI